MTRRLNSNTDRAKTTTIKFLYSYGGKILPRRSDGKLRYVGGMTRVLSVDRSISFAELMVKFGEQCGSSMSLKCKLPNEDLDVLISIMSDEDLKNLIDEYERFSASTHKDVKITAVLFPIKSLKKITPVSSAEDLSSAASIAESSVSRVSAPMRVQRDSVRAMCHRRCEGGMAYRHQNNRCPGGVSPSHMWLLPTGSFCR